MATSMTATNRLTFWIALLTALSLAFSYGLACAAPLAAFAAIAALTLSPRDGIILVVAVWLANQAAGYVLLDYPYTANSYALGVVMGAAALLALVAARLAAARLSGQGAVMAWTGAFLAAFAVYEVANFIPAVAGLGGVETFAPAVMGEIFALNAMAFAGLCGLHRLAIISGLIGHKAGAATVGR
jgi:hypothetical protein